MKLLDRFEDWTYCEEAIFFGCDQDIILKNYTSSSDVTKSLAFIALLDDVIQENDNSVIPSLNKVLVN